MGWHISPRWGYHNRAISTMEVIEELIKLAREMDAEKSKLLLGLRFSIGQPDLDIPSEKIADRGGGFH